MIPDAPDPVFQKFCEDHGIQAIHLPVDKVKDNVPLTYNRAVEAVQVRGTGGLLSQRERLGTLKKKDLLISGFPVVINRS